VSRREAEEFTTLEATFCATDMLSRATSVTGAALDVREIADHDPGYQLYKGRKQVISYILVRHQHSDQLRHTIRLCVWESERSRAALFGDAGDSESAPEGLAFTLLRDPFVVMEAGVVSSGDLDRSRRRIQISKTDLGELPPSATNRGLISRTSHVGLVGLGRVPGL
jgi:hypothetical protein